MKITKIEKQKKDMHRYNIFFDGEFAFGLYEDSVLKFGLRTGDEADEDKIKEMKEFDEIGFGKKVAYAYLAYKQRSSKELKQKLKQKKISENTIDKVIGLLEKQKYLDDKSYAKNFLEERLRRKPIGKRLAKMKLSEKGIDKETVEETIEDNYSEGKEVELARGLLAKYKKNVKGNNEAEKKSKCYRYLISRGFDYETVREAINIEN
ncbi:MAG: RecX family transcriptional regulator [Bacteroidota bacterium]|nr:RecX family transcriptional regulator [Bacteroidota bacterium]